MIRGMISVEPRPPRILRFNCSCDFCFEPLTYVAFWALREHFGNELCVRATFPYFDLQILKLCDIQGLKGDSSDIKCPIGDLT